MSDPRRPQPDSRPPWGALPAGLTRAELMAAVRAVLDRLVPDGAAVVLALSGGPDSTALAYLVSEARGDLRACVAHVRHGLRDDAEDARVAAAHARALGLPYHERRVHVEPRDEGPEAAARRARYTALAGVARTNGAAWVLVGHTADDQAETLLLNEARGTGLRGLAGMAESRPEGDVRIVRPLLRIRRQCVRTFVRGEGLVVAEDPTNRDPRQPRARVRQDVLPALEELADADVVGALARLADLTRDDADALDDLASAQARRLVARWGPARAVRVDDLSALPRALATRGLRLLLASVRTQRTQGPSADAVAAILALGAGQSLHVAGGAWVTCGGGWLAAVPTGTSPLFTRSLAIPGSTPLDELGLEIRVDLPWGAARTGAGQGRLDLGAATAPPLRAAAPPPGLLAPLPPRTTARAPGWTALPAGGRLSVRARRDGDRLRLRAGRRKLQDLLVDHGVPRALRDLVPVVVDAEDEPVWIPGVAVRACDPEAPAVLRLWLAPLPGAGLG